MIISRYTNIKSFISIFGFIFLLSLFYSLPSLRDLSTDLGYYYLGSSLLDKNFILYENWFDHKGPLIYLFLYTLNFFIDLGVYQIWGSIILIFIIYLTITHAIIKDNYKINIENILLIIFCSSIFYIQDFNYVISIFKYLLIFASSNFFLKGNLIFSKSFLALAVLTRIDAVIYLIPMIFYYFYIDNNNIYKTFKFFITTILIFFLYLFFFSLILNFGIKDYFLSNFLWNLNTYQNLHSITTDINAHEIKIFFGSYWVFVVHLFNEIDFSKKFHLFYAYIAIIIYLIIQRKKYINISKHEMIFLSLICISGLLVFFLSKSSKSYHIMSIYFPIYFSIIYIIKNNKKFLKDIVFVFISLILLYKPIVNGTNTLKENCFKYEENCATVISVNSKLIKYLKSQEQKEMNIIFDEPYFFIETNVKPNLGYGNFIVFRDDNLQNIFHRNIVKNFSNLKKNDKIIIPKGYNKFLNKKYVNIIINNTELLEQFENYDLYVITSNFTPTKSNLN